MANDLRQSVAILRVVQLLAAGLASIQFMHNHTNPESKARASISLLAGIATDMGAIVSLIEAGYDIQAKSIVRTFGERLDLLVAIQLDRAFAKAFVENSEIEDANRFWQREVARNKVVKRVSSRLRRFSVYGETPIDQEWIERRREMNRWLSTATHPSYLAGWFAFLPNLGREDNGQWDGENGLYGQHSAICVVTARAAFSRLLEFLYLIEWRKGFFERPDAPDVAREMKALIKQPKKFLWKCLSEAYFSPNIELFQVYAAIHGYKIIKDAEV